MMEKKVRVRFAPSPTGPLHIGGVRTALYNYLFAKKHGGDFILRIEDTDQNRFVPGAEEYIIESLDWCGIKFNEGVHKGGPYSPYRQSERKNIYKQYADYLIEKGYAYYAFDSAEELDIKRKEFELQKKTFQYGSENRMTFQNSLTINSEEVKQKISNGEHYVIRIKIPENETIEVNDLIRGKVLVNSSLLDDKVLFKSDGLPTYHLANVVDDYLMKVSHVIRGEEWLPSAPLHVLLYRYLGWESEMPIFAHLPLLLKPDGNGKLSKRDGDKLGFPVFPLQWVDPKSKEISSGYRESGYLPEAVVNMLALLGWNPGTEQELFTMDELIQAFSIDRVGKSGSKFDHEKAKWFNHQYLINTSNEEVANIFSKILEEKNIKTDYDYILKVCSIVKERVNFINEMWQQSSFFFIAPLTLDPKSLKDKWKENSSELVLEIQNIISNASDFSANALKEVVSIYIQENQLAMGQIMNALRICIVGASTGPDLFEIISMIGKDETIKRINFAIKK
ncbi:MAG: glutamate--tRNA ligase [Bacteroidetes bacterium]|nr:glutamate--tRNA ligase [Bacteroidota bacterium]